jgi:hypothetical protein
VFTVLADILLTPVILPPVPLPTVSELETVTSLVRPIVIDLLDVLVDMVTLLPVSKFNISLPEVANIKELFEKKCN